jgi:hypothetical protein
MNTLGFGHQVAAGNWVADDFIVGDSEGWNINKLSFFAYQTNSPITSTMTDTNWMIFDDEPGVGTVVANGEGLSYSGWTNIFRVTEENTGVSTARPIMVNEVDISATLPQGTYWLAWQADGELSSGPWAPPITVDGVLTTGNALQYSSTGGGWVPALDSNTQSPQGLPFIIEGTLGTGRIAVSPAFLEIETPPESVVSAALTISNTGTADLDWQILEDTNPAAYVPPEAVESSSEAAGLLHFGPSNPSGVSSSAALHAPDAELVLNQLPNQANGIFTDASCDFCGGTSQVLAENFTLSGPATIHSIVTWGGYYPGDVPTPDDFTVIFHEDDVGLPGTSIITQTDVASYRYATGMGLFGVSEYEQTLTLNPPVYLGAGSYWVEIYNDTGLGTDDWFWETGSFDIVGNGLVGNAFSFAAPGDAWTLDTAQELSIQLRGAEEACDIPEDLPWLSVSPSSGTTGAGASTLIDVTFDAVGLSAGHYSGTLCIESSDPETPLVRVPLTMTVSMQDTYLPLLMRAPVTTAEASTSSPSPLMGLAVLPFAAVTIPLLHRFRS